MSITQALRDQLKVIATSVDTNINSLLNMATADQLEAIVEQHGNFLFLDPNTKDTENKLTGITKRTGSVLNGEWQLTFSNGRLKTVDYLLHDLEIQDVLSLLQTVENVLSPCEV